MAQDARDLIQKPDKPLAEMTPAEKLANNAAMGLDRMAEILAADRDPIGPETDPKWARLVGDMADKAVKRYAEVQLAALQQAQDKGWEELQARIDEHRRKYPKKNSE